MNRSIFREVIDMSKVSCFFYTHIVVAKTCQLLTEIQNTVNLSPITLGKIATILLYMRIDSHHILVNIRFGIPYLYHTSSTMQRPTLTITITLTLTLHLLLNSQLVTCDELTY